MNEGITMNEITDALIQRAANAYGIGCDAREIHDMLKAEGLSEYNIFLVYCAGKVIVESSGVDIV